MDYQESWASKNDAFELWCWRRLLRVPWTARRSNQSILKEISPGCSLEGLLKLKLQHFGHLIQRADSFEKILMLGKIEGRKRRGRQRMKWFGSHHWLIVDMSLSKLKEIVKDRVAWCAAVHVLQRLRHDLVTEQWQQFAFCVLLACTYHPLSTSLLYSTTWCSSLHLYFPCSILDRSFI